MRALFASLLLATSLFAGPKVGEPFPETVLPDQYDKEQRVTATDLIVLISFEKDVSGAINDYLKTKPTNFMDLYRIKYISDISPMPTIITKMFALPKMRDYHYPVMLIYDDSGEKYDKREGMVTVYRLDNGILKSVDFIAPDALPKLFGE
jgi:hypothetical protein